MSSVLVPYEYANMKGANMAIVTGTLDGKQIAWDTEHTEFLVQVGRYTKGAYKTRYSFTGNLPQACAWYRGINIGRGYKKRLLMPSSPNPVLAREQS